MAYNSSFRVRRLPRQRTLQELSHVAKLGLFCVLYESLPHCNLHISAPACLSLLPLLLLLHGSLLSPDTASAAAGSTNAGQRVKPQEMPSVLTTFPTKSIASVLLSATCQVVGSANTRAARLQQDGRRCVPQVSVFAKLSKV